MSILVDQAELATVMTSSLQSEPFFNDAAKSFQTEWRLLIADINQLLIRCNLHGITDNLLLHLATEFRLDFYDSTLPRASREALVLGAPQWLARLGTPSVLDEVLSTVFLFSQIQEWWEYGGSNFHFRVVTSDTFTDPTKINSLFNIVHHLKNVRSVFDGVFRFGNASTPGVFFGLSTGTASHQLIRFTR